MYGRYILSLSAGLLFLCGGVALFAPDELARSLGAGEARAFGPVMQVAAAGLLGFATLDWMSRGNRIGGIYARPLAIGNLLFFTVASSSLGRAVATERLPAVCIGLTIALAGFAIAFGWLAFLHDPLSRSETARR